MSGEALLFVDDEVRILRSLKALFRNQFDVHTAETGQEALEIVRTNRIHVVVSDQRMPQMLGVELLEKIKEISPNTMRILLTGYSDIPAIVNSINHGEVFRYITKPWERKEISDTVNQAARIARNLFSVDSIPSGSARQRFQESRQENILVLDPGQDLYALIERLFKQYNPVHYANDPERALEILDEQPVAVVVCYIRKARREGVEFLKLLKQKYPLAVTVAIMHQADSDTAISLINQGQVFRYLPVPVSPGRMRLSIQSGIKYYQQMRQRPELLSRHEVDVPKRSFSASSSSSLDQNSGLMQKLSSLRRKMMLRLGQQG